jgi:hypothetical protein
MKRLGFLLLTAYIGTALLAMGCGGTSEPAGSTQPAASAAPAPAEPAATPAAASEPSQAGATDETASIPQEPQTERKRFVAPIRGTANIEILAPSTKREKGEVVTKIKVRNASTGAIALLTVSETWYDKAGNALGGDSYKYRKPFLPGEVIDVELHTPYDSKFNANQLQFTHANGNIEVKTVKKFPEAS